MKLNGIKITWLGHATFLIETPGGKKVIVDPWVTGNPVTPADKKTFERLDLMLCTHGHSDHVGDAVDLAKKHNPHRCWNLRNVPGAPEAWRQTDSPNE